MAPTARPSRRARLHAALAAGALLLAACGGRGDRLPVERRIPLAQGVGDSGSLALYAGRLWLADRGSLRVLDPAGRLLSRVPVEAARPARIVAVGPATVYLHSAGTRLLAVDPRDGRVRGRRAVVGADGFALDRVTGEGYLVAPHGGVLGVEPESLRPHWGWPERGAAGTAIAVSPLGDRVYLALGGGDPRIQVRDAQSGRVLGETETGEEVRRLAAGPDGVLYAVLGGALLALRPGAAGVETVWRERMELDDPLRLAVSPRGDRLAVALPEQGEVRVLDARTGRVLRAARTGAVDVFFAPDGALYVLEREGIARVRRE